MLAVSEKGSTPAQLEAHNAPYHVGAVALRVRDLAGLTAFYRDAIGLKLISQQPDKAIARPRTELSRRSPRFP